ncbi:MAG: glycosyltransferase [Cellvibrionales bacterium]|jgi:dTDP-glucose pyrophosphorylase|nr:glycosyltransferase [Cellvibrionales bacterium]MBK8676526.1 glycosyltransferase [Cellvibrionales bacterium]TXH51525.1 MAG: glycosyltransferase [Cellvibrionales bacterium]
MFEIGVIPVAGAGLRLYPYTESTPKTLLEVGGQSLLLNNIAILRDQLGVKKIFLIIGHQGERIRAAIGDGANLGVQIEYLACSDISAGLACGLLLLRDHIHSHFPVILGDELYLDSNHAQLLRYAAEPADVVCGIKTTGDTTLIRKNYAVTLQGDRITSLEEKPEVIKNHYLGCGTYIFSPAIFDAIENTPASTKTGRVELTEVIDRWAQQGADVRAAVLKGSYRNINYPEDYISAMNLYRKLNFSQYRVSLVIPTYNESAAIGDVIEDFRDKVDEIIVADNQSPDGTADIARAKGATVISKPLAGYGEALRCALQAATGDILVLMEGDASFTADDLPKILAYMRDADMVIGTRTTKQMIEQGANMDAFLRWGNVLAAKVLQFLWIRQEPRFTDLGCTYRAIWRDTYLTIRDNLSAVGPAFSPEMMVEVLRAERKIIEIPVTYRPRIGDVSKHSGSKLAILKTGTKMLWLIFKRRLGFR